MKNTYSKTLEQLDPFFLPFLEGYQQCLEKTFQNYSAIKEFRNNNCELYVDLENSAKCGMIQSYFWAHAQKEFANTPEIEISKWNGVKGALINKKWFVRFNKVSEKGAMGGVTTKQRDLFLSQRQISCFPEGVQYIISGYKPNLSWTGADSIYFAYWDGGDSPRWKCTIANNSSFEEQMDIPFFEEDRKARGFKAKPRQEDLEKETGSGSGS